jgi:hypothetical protein
MAINLLAVGSRSVASALIAPQSRSPSQRARVSPAETVWVENQIGLSVNVLNVVDKPSPVRHTREAR